MSWLHRLWPQRFVDTEPSDLTQRAQVAVAAQDAYETATEAASYLQGVATTMGDHARDMQRLSKDNDDA